MSIIWNERGTGIAGAERPRRSCTRGLAGVARAAVLVATSLMAAPLAWAANAGMLSVPVEIKPSADSPLGSPTVSVSRSQLASYVSAKLTVKNGGSNTINKVVVQATTTVFDGPSPSVAVANYASLVNLGSGSPNCTATGPAVVTVTCAIGQLASNESREFFLIFKMPTTGTKVNLNVSTDFSAGNSSSAPPADFEFAKVRDFPITLTTVDSTDVNRKVKTVLPPEGGDVFTGPEAVVSSVNPSSARVRIPFLENLVTENQIEQELPSGSYMCPTAANPTYRCFGLASNIDVKSARDGAHVLLDQGSGGPILTITLRQDLSTLGAKPYPKIQDVTIFYLSDKEGDTLAPVPKCVANVVVPLHYKPCWQTRTSVVKGNKGYYEYVILAKDNGRFSW
jgi:hypothetical protein